MAEQGTTFAWKILVGVVVVGAGGAAAYYGIPHFLEDKRVARVVTVPDIPEVTSQANWVLAQQQKPPGEAAGALGSAPEEPVAVEGAPPGDEGVGEGAVAVEGAPPGEEDVGKTRPEVAAAPEPAKPAAGAPAPASETEAAGAVAEAPRPADEPVTGTGQTARNEPEPAEAPETSPETETSSTGAFADVEPPYELEITATARQVWVWVTPDGGPQEAVSLERGESATFEAKEGYVLTVDDAGGIEATLNGKPLPSFGRKAQARREVTIPSPELEPVG